MNKSVVHCAKMCKKNCNLTHITFTSLSITPSFLQILGSIFTNNSASLTFNIMITYSSDYVCRYDPGISIVATHLRLCASLVEAIIIDSRDTVVDTDYTF